MVRWKRAPFCNFIQLNWNPEGYLIRNNNNNWIETYIFQMFMVFEKKFAKNFWWKRRIINSESYFIDHLPMFWHPFWCIQILRFNYQISKLTHHRSRVHSKVWHHDRAKSDGWHQECKLLNYFTNKQNMDFKSI